MPPVAEMPFLFTPLGQTAFQNSFYWPTPQVTSWVEKGLPANLPALVYAKISSTALQRLNDFYRWPAGWNNGSGEEIAWGTLTNFEDFLNTVRFRSGNPPSLFLTDSGHLELVWEARDGSEMNVAFTPGGATYFFGKDNEEGEVSARELAALAARATELTL
jgi:hypothetical protein